MAKKPTAKEIVQEFCDDIKQTYGKLGEGYIHTDELDEEELDWPDLAQTYKRAMEYLYPKRSPNAKK